MTTLLTISLYKVILAVSIIIAILIFLFIVAYFVSKLSAFRFKMNYEFLKECVNNREVTKENYDRIMSEFSDLYCHTEAEQALIKKLYLDFQYRFREFVPKNEA